ncbi:hypothetical protein [Fusobacterium varium]|uniref:hypothetical protein n=1 Tax=Fusobacterium varium TaxID=856 RepID=UPI0027DD4152|nr:hypothetical protein [uncultured Fusobacterium sp.]
MNKKIKNFFQKIKRKFFKTPEENREDFSKKIFYIADEITYLENTLKKYNFYSARIYFSFKDDSIIEDIEKGLEKRKLFNYEIIKKDNNIKLILTKK